MATTARTSPSRRLSAPSDTIGRRRARSTWNRCVTGATSISTASGFADATTHPAFRNTARMTARLFDALHDPARSARILLPTDTGGHGKTHAFFKAPKTLEESIAGRDAIAEWQRMTYGWMGRSPDYKAAFLGTLGANADFYDPFQNNARRWYTFCQERVPFVNHAIIHPPVDRDKPPDRGCRHLRPRRERDRWRNHRLGRQGRCDRLGADQLHVYRAPRIDSAAGQEICAGPHACRPTREA